MRRGDVGKINSDQSLRTGSGDAGRLPNGWRWVELGELVESMKNGLYKPASQYADDGIACLRMYNIDGGHIVWRNVKRMRLTEAELEDYRLLPGDLLVNRVNSRELVGKSAVIPPGLEPSVFESKNIRLRVRREVVDPAFLNYRLLEAGSDYFNRNAQQVVGMASISQPQVARFLVPLPSLDRQREIVAQLDAQFTRLDAGVAGLDRVRANLARYRAAVLKAACEGRLVPQEAELSHRDKRSYETGDSLLARILAGRQAKEASSRKQLSRPDLASLPQLPTGWAWATVGQLGEIQLGRQRSPEHHSGPFMRPYLRVANVFEDRLDLNDVKKMNFTPKEYATFRLEPNDILLNEGQSLELVGRAALYRGEIPGACFQNTLIRFRPADGLQPRFALCVFRAFLHDGRFQKVAKWTTNIAHLGAGRFGQMLFPLPPIAEQLRIVAEVERHLSVIDEVDRVASGALARAASLRSAILQRAFSGRLREVSTTHEKVQPTTVSAQLRHFARAVLSAEIVSKLHSEPTFGRIKHQKIFHLCEHVARLDEIQGEYHREAAGPLDNRLVYANEAELKKQHWFRTVRRDGHGHSYGPMSKAGGHRKYAERYWPDQLRTIERLIELMRTWKTDRCEIFSTVYAAWNDLILWQRPVTDDAIVHEILNRWHSAKRQIAEARWRKAIQWVRENGFEPTGFGRATASPE